MSKEKLKINWLSFAVLVIYPLLLIAAGVLYAQNYGVSWFEFGFLIAAYYGSNISVGIGFHRLWSHATYKTNIVVETILVFLTAGTLQGPVLAWASDHYKHHTFTDKEGDPHSPLKYKSKFLGFMWSHILWMLLTESSFKHIDKLTMKKLGKKKILVWQLKYYWQLAVFMNLILPLALGYLMGGSLISAVGAYIFIGIGRALQQQMTFCVNSLCHFIGGKSYYAGTARDIWWLFFALLGENWHNFHHAFANDYRNGHKWYHMDVHKWIIYTMEKLGLAWDLVRTSDERIKAKIQYTKESLASDILKKLESFEVQAKQIKAMAKEAHKKVEKKFIKAGEKVDELALVYRDNLQKLENKTDAFRAKIHQVVTDKKELSEEMLVSMRNRLSQLERMSWNMGLQLQA